MKSLEQATKELACNRCRLSRIERLHWRFEACKRCREEIQEQAWNDPDHSGEMVWNSKKPARFDGWSFLRSPPRKRINASVPLVWLCWKGTESNPVRVLAPEWAVCFIEADAHMTSKMQIEGTDGKQRIGNLLGFPFARAIDRAVVDLVFRQEATSVWSLLERDDRGILFARWLASLPLSANEWRRFRPAKEAQPCRTT